MLILQKKNYSDKTIEELKQRSKNTLSFLIMISIDYFVVKRKLIFL